MNEKNIDPVKNPFNGKMKKVEQSTIEKTIEGRTFTIEEMAEPGFFTITEGVNKGGLAKVVQANTLEELEQAAIQFAKSFKRADSK